MDYLTELETELSNFTDTLFRGVNEINQKSDTLDQASRVKFINSLSTELMNSHNSVMNVVGKIPEEIFSTTREAQENEIKALELKYEQSVNRLEKLKIHAKNVFECLEQNLDTM
jgi:hypothetical protein